MPYRMPLSRWNTGGRPSQWISFWGGKPCHGSGNPEGFSYIKSASTVPSIFAQT